MRLNVAASLNPGFLCEKFKSLHFFFPCLFPSPSKIQLQIFTRAKQPLGQTWASVQHGTGPCCMVQAICQFVCPCHKQHITDITLYHSTKAEIYTGRRKTSELIYLFCFLLQSRHSNICSPVTWLRTQ